MKLPLAWRSLLGAIPLLFTYSCFEPLDFEAARPVCEPPNFDSTARDQYCSGTIKQVAAYPTSSSVMDLDALGGSVLITSGQTLNIEGLTLLQSLDVRVVPRASLFGGEQGSLGSPINIAQAEDLEDFSLPPRFSALAYEDPPAAFIVAQQTIGFFELRQTPGRYTVQLPERTLFTAGFVFDLALYPPQSGRADALLALGPAGIKSFAFKRSNRVWVEEKPRFSVRSANANLPPNYCETLEGESVQRCLDLCPACEGLDNPLDVGQGGCKQCLLDDGLFFFLGEELHAYSLDIAPAQEDNLLYVGGLDRVLVYDADDFLISTLNQFLDEQQGQPVEMRRARQDLSLPRAEGAPPHLLVSATEVTQAATYFVAQDSRIWGIEGLETFSEEWVLKPDDLGAAYLYVAPRGEDGALGALGRVALPEGLRSAERVVIAPLSESLVAVRGLRAVITEVDDNPVRQGRGPVLALVDVLDPAHPLVVWTKEDEGEAGELPQGALADPDLERLLLPRVEELGLEEISLRGRAP